MVGNLRLCAPCIEVFGQCFTTKPKERSCWTIFSEFSCMQMMGSEGVLNLCIVKRLFEHLKSLFLIIKTVHGRLVLFISMQSGR
jgi:hypothetical protein